MNDKLKQLAKDIAAGKDIRPEPPAPVDLRTILVVCATYHQFLYWCVSHGHSPSGRGPRPYVRYVSSPRGLLGYDGKGARAVITGTWSDKLYDIRDELARRGIEVED